MLKFFIIPRSRGCNTEVGIGRKENNLYIAILCTKSGG